MPSGFVKVNGKVVSVNPSFASVDGKSCIYMRTKETDEEIEQIIKCVESSGMACLVVSGKELDDKVKFVKKIKDFVAGVKNG
jgi:siroheme synthase